MLHGITWCVFLKKNMNTFCLLFELCCSVFLCPVWMASMLCVEYKKWISYDCFPSVFIFLWCFNRLSSCLVRLLKHHWVKKQKQSYALLKWDHFSVILVKRVIHIPDCHSTQAAPSFIPFSFFKSWALSSICLSGQDLTSHLWGPAHLVTPNLQLIVSLTSNG